METNILNNLTTFINNCYENGKATAGMFANNQMWKEAENTIKMYVSRACGATEFAAMLCHENGYPDTAGEILEKWNGTWNEWFADLVKEYGE